MAVDIPTTVRGYVAEASGNSPWALDVDTLIQEVPELTDRHRAVGVYTQMRRDPKITAVLRAVGLLIGRATWTVDPSGASGRTAQDLADDLGLPVTGEDRPEEGRARGVLWPEHLRAALLHLPYGHMGFETEAAIRDGRARIAGMYERMPHTIQDIKHDKQGRLTEIVQEPLGSMKPVPIDAKNVVWYCHEREGAAWRGQSILRPAYGPWLIKHEMLRVAATGMRRNAMGAWTVNAPPGATDEQVMEAQRLASAMRAGESAGAGLPAGYKAQLVGMIGTAPDPLTLIRYCDQQMSGMVLAQFLDLGTTETGSRAVSESFVDFFLLAVETIALDIAAQATRQIAVPYTDWNDGEQAPAPRITVSDVGASHDLTVEALTALVQADVISPDEGVEQYARRAWRLPPRQGGAVVPAVRAATARRPQPAAASARQPHVHAAATADDAPDPESADDIDREWAAALAALLLLYRRKRQDDIEDIVAQVRDAATAGVLAGLTGLTVIDPAGAGLILDATAAAAEAGARTAVDEAARQDAAIDVPDLAELEQGLADRAAVIDRLLTDGLINSAVRDATRRWGLSPDDLADAVRGTLEGLSVAWVEGHLGGALTSAINDGRAVTQRAGGATKWEAVEVLDTAICRPCSGVAGRTYTSLHAALADYPSGQYRDCLGRERCRGYLHATYGGSA